MFEMQIAKGTEYLNQDLGPSWIDRINLEELQLDNCYYCIIGQLYGDFWEKFFFINEGAELGFSISINVPLFMSPAEYEQLTKEWKNKIMQLKAERSNGNK